MVSLCDDCCRCGVPVSIVGDPDSEYGAEYVCGCGTFKYVCGECGSPFDGGLGDEQCAECFRAQMTRAVR